MRLEPPPKNFVKRIFYRMHHSGKHHVRRRPYILPLFGLILGIGIVAGVVIAKDGDLQSHENSYVVYLYDKGKKQTINTRSDTVRELIGKLPLGLIKEDVVEPSLDTPIVEDNFRVNIYRARPVTVVDTEERKVTLTAQRSARVVAERAGLKVYSEDIVEFRAGDVTKNIIGEQVAVDRATPMTLNLYGKSLSLRTQADTVGELLAEKQVVLGTNDKVQPAENTQIKANTQVFVIRSGVRLKTIERDVPIPTESVKDPRLTHGTTVLRQEGAAGREAVTYEIKLKNGKEVGRKVIQRVLTVKPVPRLVAVGSAPLSLSLQQWLYQLRMCETGGNYKTNTGNGYYGAYQFALATWQRLGSPYYPNYSSAHLAPPAVQDQAVILNTNRSSGGLATQHPGCYQKLGLSQFPPSNR